ncbi:glycosyltransferase family 39 protein [Microcystis sp. BLCC-F210]|uniref:glycosyltransferase family 39 protein n=1 Tax=Microcystis sp. BLCC-F210 TaxID=3342751 RepID=UPI0035C8B1E2
MNNSSKRNIIKISLITFLWLAVINTGFIRGDTLARLSITHSIWTGEPEIQLDTNYKPLSRLDNTIGNLSRDGKRYHAYEVGQSLLMLPGDWLGTTIHQLIPRIPEELSRRFVVNWLIFVPINIAVVISAYYLLIKLEFSEKIATISSITWLLTTTVLNYAQNNQQNNQVLLFVILAYIAIFNYLKNNKIINIYLSGVALGCAFLVRTTSIIHIATTLLFLFGILLYKRKSWFFWFLCGNGVYTDSFFSKIVLKVFLGKYFTIL